MREIIETGRDPESYIEILRNSFLTSLNPNNWNSSKVRNNPILTRVRENLIKNGYLLVGKDGTLSFNPKKATTFEGFIKSIGKVHNELAIPELGAYDEFTALLPKAFPLLITVREFVPTVILTNYPIATHYSSWSYIISQIPINAVVSSDRHVSFGVSQMLRTTYNSLRRHFPHLLKENYENCISLDCQLRATFALVYSDLSNSYRYLTQISTFNAVFKNIWGSSSIPEKRRFVVFLGALLINAGWNKTTRTALYRALKRKPKTLEGLIKNIIVEADRAMKGNDSGTYSKNVLEFYEFLLKAFKKADNPQFYNMLIEPAFRKPVIEFRRKVTKEKEEEAKAIVYLRKVRRKSFATGNTYYCYVFTIDSKQEGYEDFWNRKMLESLLANPTEENINKILAFNGKKEIRGVIAIPEQFFDKKIGEELIVVENRWETYRDIVLNLTNAKTQEEVDRYRAILYALNNSKEAKELRFVRIPRSFLR